jgi:hypothetical protein
MPVNPSAGFTVSGCWESNCAGWAWHIALKQGCVMTLKVVLGFLLLVLKPHWNAKSPVNSGVA